MFTGIVQGMAQITAIEKKQQALRMEIDLGQLGQDVQLGASVAVAGVCLTASAIQDKRICFDVIGETLDKTAISMWRVGDLVNIERSARFGDEIGGHVVSGHVSDTVTIDAIEKPGDNVILRFRCDPQWMSFIFAKGFIALDGCSLTIVDVGDDWFTVHLIPETLRRTTFGLKQIGDRVHLEIDAMTKAVVETVQRMKL